jgi:hypothetical protein
MGTTTHFIMKKLLSRFVLVGASLLGLSSVASAALDTSAVPSDAKWMLQVDFSALRESPVGREVIAMVEKDKAAVFSAGSIKIDAAKVLATLESATAYGTVFSKNPDEVDGTLLVKGTDEFRKIVEAVVTQATVSQPDAVTELKGLPFTAYTIKGKLIVGFPPETIVLVSRSQPQMQKAYELFKGKGPASARAASTLKAMAPHRPLMVFAASEVPNTDGLFDENQPQARILKMASAASVAISNDSKVTSATVQLVASNDDYSDKLLKIVQGMVAMLSLAQSDDKQLAEFMRSVKADRDGRTIVVSFSYPNEGLIKMIHDMQQAQMHRPDMPPRHERRPVEGRVVDSWIADKDTGTNTVTRESLLTHTTENIPLKNGSIIILTSEREGGENGRIDYVDIVPAGGGQPLHFEAENMKLWHYQVEKTQFASGGRDIMLGQHQTGTAKFEFPGVDGTYTLKVRYADENDGKATFSVSLQDPEPAAGESEGESLPAPEAPQPPVAPGAK